MKLVIICPRTVRRRDDSLAVQTALFDSLGALPLIWAVLAQLQG
jgi:hypothetical protein